MCACFVITRKDVERWPKCSGYSNTGEFYNCFSTYIDIAIKESLPTYTKQN